jgi:hypothetical protein
MDCLPLPVVCIQCGPGVNNPCHFKFIGELKTGMPQVESETHVILIFPPVPIAGPTIGFVVAVFLAIICWPLALFFCCCATDAGKK